MDIWTNEMPALRAFGFLKCSSLIFPSYYLKGWVPGIARIFFDKKKSVTSFMPFEALQGELYRNLAHRESGLSQRALIPVMPTSEGL
jgi:hypothetical protein